MPLVSVIGYQILSIPLYRSLYAEYVPSYGLLVEIENGKLIPFIHGETWPVSKPPLTGVIAALAIIDNERIPTSETSPITVMLLSHIA
jgi:hypothetical protein